MDNTELHETLTRAVMQGYIEGNVRRYSGRGMMGRDCIGLSGSFTSMEVGVAICQAAVELGHSIEDVPTRTSQDNMGMDIIIYWSNMAWDNDMVDSEEVAENQRQAQYDERELRRRRRANDKAEKFPGRYN